MNQRCVRWNHWMGVISLVLLTGLSGCLGRSPDPRLYTLGASPRALDATVSSSIAVRVGPAHFPRYLERPQMARRLIGGEVAIDEYNRWVGGFENNVLRALTLDLGNRLGSDRVVAHPDTPPFPVDYQIRIDFDEFVIGPESSLHLRARWAIAGRKQSGEPVLGRTDLDFALAGEGKLAVVVAHDDAIRALGATIAERIQEIESTP